MLNVEIAGQKIEYRDVPELNKKLGALMKELAADELGAKQTFLTKRRERREVARLLGLDSRKIEAADEVLGSSVGS